MHVVMNQPANINLGQGRLEDAENTIKKFLLAEIVVSRGPRWPIREHVIFGKNKRSILSLWKISSSLRLLP